MFAVEKFFNDGENIFRMNSNLSFLHSDYYFYVAGYCINGIFVVSLTSTTETKSASGKAHALYSITGIDLTKKIPNDKVMTG
jgi:hypothetical protein